MLALVLELVVADEEPVLALVMALALEEGRDQDRHLQEDRHLL